MHSARYDFMILFDAILFQWYKAGGGNDDSKRCLKKAVRGLNNVMRSGRGTMGKLKMIDSLNNFLSVRRSTLH